MPHEICIARADPMHLDHRKENAESMKSTDVLRRWAVADSLETYLIRNWGSGYFSIKDMARAGTLMTVLAALCVAASVETSRLAGW